MKRIVLLLAVLASVFTYSQTRSTAFKVVTDVVRDTTALDGLENRKGALVYVQSTQSLYVADGTTWREQLQDANLTQIGNAVVDSVSGWVNYADTTYTAANPFSLVGMDTTRFPLSCGSVLDVQAPLGRPILFDCTDSTITGLNGDGIIYTIDFVAVPTQAGTTTIDVWVDIGGSVGILYNRLATFPKGQGVARTIVVSTAAYTLDTWEANGAKIFIVANGNCNIYNMRVLIHRIHAARQ